MNINESLTVEDDTHYSQKMLEKLASDYSLYFKVDLYLSISKLQEFLEESAAKLDELSSLFEMNQAETNDWLQQTLPEIIHVSVKYIADVKRRIDTLEALLQVVKTTLDKQEAQIVQAEHAFVGNSSSFRSVLNYFRRPPDVGSIPKTTFEPVALDVDSYFSASASSHLKHS